MPAALAPDTTTTPRVALVSAQRDDGTPVARLLRRTVGPIAEARDLNGVMDAKGVPLVVVMYDSMSRAQRNELVEALERRTLHSTLLLLSRQCAHEDFATLFAAHALTNMLVVRESGVDAADLRVTVQKILNRQLFGLEKYFGWGVRIHTCALRTSTERADVLDRVANHASSLGISPRLRELVRNVADEFLTNALYNAPTTADGAPRFAGWSRTTPIELEPEQHVELRFCCDGVRFGLSAVDPFGSLSRERVQDYLAKGFRRGDDQVHQGPGGAGLGLYQILDSLSHFVINIAPGHQTEMIGLLDVSGGYKTFAEAGKSFNMFVQESAP